MKQDLSIVEMAQKIQAQQDSSRDFIADTRKIELETVDNNVNLSIDGNEPFTMSDHAHSQVAARVGIPQKYYQRMREDSPHLLLDNVHHWFRVNPEKRMIRTLDGKARAFLSDRYKRIDNLQIAEAALPALMDNNSGLEILSSSVTENKMYIQARFPRIEGEVKVGDIVQAGLIISNSEIGAGSLDIKPMFYRLWCLNGCTTPIVADSGRLKRTHLGARIQETDDYSIYQDDTRKADDHALMLKIRDSIKALSDPALFAKLMDEMQAAAQSEQIVNPVAATEVLGKAFNLPETERNSFIENLIRDQDYSKWGALNAVTYMANDTESYDRAIALEELGGKILTMPQSQWSMIAKAA